MNSMTLVISLVPFSLSIVTNGLFHRWICKNLIFVNVQTKILKNSFIFF